MILKLEVIASVVFMYSSTPLWLGVVWGMGAGINHIGAYHSIVFFQAGLLSWRFSRFGRLQKLNLLHLLTIQNAALLVVEVENYLGGIFKRTLRRFPPLLHPLL